MRIPRVLRSMILDSRVSDGVHRTREVLLALGERVKMSQAELAVLRGVSLRTLKGHLAALRGLEKVQISAPSYRRVYRKDCNLLDITEWVDLETGEIVEGVTRPPAGAWASRASAPSMRAAAAELEELRRTRWQVIPWTEETLGEWEDQWKHPYYSMSLAQQKAYLLKSWGVREEKEEPGTFTAQELRVVIADIKAYADRRDGRLT